VVELPPPIQQGPPEEAYVLGGLFHDLVFFHYRLHGHAGSGAKFRHGHTIPRETGERLLRMEQALEATAEEVERIGEGQAISHAALHEGEGARAIGAGMRSRSSANQ